MTILNKLFSRSPFYALQDHMKRVSLCVLKLEDLFEANAAKDYEKVDALCREISKLEHDADITKNEIRNNLPKGLFLPVHRGDLLEILALQDTIADRAEDISVLISIKKLPPVEPIHEDLRKMLEKNISAFKKTCDIIHQMDELLESSFGGREAEKVREMVVKVAYYEHEVDLIQRKLLKKLYNMEHGIDYRDFMLWISILQKMASIADVCEKLANRIRMLLDVR